MSEMPDKVKRALGAMRGVGFTDVQQRRVARRLDEALKSPAQQAAALDTEHRVRPPRRSPSSWWQACGRKCTTKRAPRPSSPLLPRPKEHDALALSPSPGSAIGSATEPSKARFADRSSVQLAAGESPSHGTRRGFRELGSSTCRGRPSSKSRSVPIAPSSRR